MAADARRARDPDLLDAVDALPRTPFAGAVWRVVREGRDPVLGTPSQSRWCNGSFEVLYTSLEQDGAIAEVHALLSLQPVFPSKLRWFANGLRVAAAETLDLTELALLERLGVETGRYRDRDYRRTQEIADAASFLGFDGLIAPSARWRCTSLVLFTERLAAERIETVGPPVLVDWDEWRTRTRA